MSARLPDLATEYEGIIKDALLELYGKDKDAFLQVLVYLKIVITQLEATMQAPVHEMQLSA